MYYKALQKCMAIDLRLFDDPDSFITLLKATDLHPIKISRSMCTQNIACNLSGFKDPEIPFPGGLREPKLRKSTLCPTSPGTCFLTGKYLNRKHQGRSQILSQPN